MGDCAPRWRVVARCAERPLCARCLHLRQLYFGLSTADLVGIQLKSRNVNIWTVTNFSQILLNRIVDFGAYSLFLYQKNSLKMYLEKSSMAALLVVVLIAVGLTIGPAQSNLFDVVLSETDCKTPPMAGPFECLGCCQIGQFNAYQLDKDSQTCVCANVFQDGQLLSGMSRLDDINRANRMHKMYES